MEGICKVTARVGCLTCGLLVNAQQSLPIGVAYQVRNIARICLAQQLLAVILDGVARDEQLRRNLIARAAAREHCQHLALTFG